VRLLPVSVLTALLTLAPPMLPAGGMGDVTGDGRVDGADVQAVHGRARAGDLDTLSSADTAFFLAADVDFDGAVTTRDGDLLAAYVAAVDDDEWGADARLLGIVTAIRQGSDEDFRTAVDGCRRLDRRRRERLTEVLVPYLQTGSGVRRPSAGQPGAAMALSPRDGAALAMLTLLVGQVGDVQAAVAERSSSPASLRADLDGCERRLRAVRDALDGPTPLRPATASQIRLGLSDLQTLLDEARAAVPADTVGPVPTAVAAVSSGDDDDDDAPTTPPAGRRADGSSSPLAALVGLALVALLGGGAVFYVRSRGEAAVPSPAVPRVLPAKPRRTAKPSSPGETKKLDVRKLLAAPAADGPTSVEARLRDLLPARYELLQMLGAGGMGVVYKAADRRLQRVVAIKAVLEPGEGSQADGRLRRFVREAETLAKVGHPGLPEVHDFQSEPIPYLVMEYIEGRTLDAVIQAGRVPAAQALTWIRQLFDVLDGCHRAGVLHRDIKPLNLIVDRSDRLRLVDFGLAKSADQTQRTTDGAMLGTVRYMPPETFYRSPLTERSDMYSAALVAYELVTGAYPFASEPLPAQIMQEPVPAHERDETVDFELSMLLTALLSRDPGGRPSSCAGVCRALDAQKQL